jgi:uncharacterized protein (UPF0305 family)
MQTNFVTKLYTSRYLNSFLKALPARVNNIVKKRRLKKINILRWIKSILPFL